MKILVTLLERVDVRIIAGEKRGLKLMAPQGEDVTRPTSDRVKESVFGSLQFALRDTSVLDLFAGSGALGIEALSRGAKKCIFVEKDGEALECLKRNIKAANFTAKSTVLYCDYTAALKRLQNNGEKFDFVFLDPPYRDKLYGFALLQLNELELITDSTILVLEHLYAMKVDIPEGFTVVRSKKIGATGVLFVKREQIL